MVDIDSAEGDSDAGGVETFGGVKAVTTGQVQKLLTRSLASAGLAKNTNKQSLLVFAVGPWRKDTTPPAGDET